MEFFKNSWDEVLEEEFNKPYFKKLLEDVDQEYQTHTVYPPQGKIFNAFKMCDYKSVKVVILGQDPYHGRGQAHGLSFSVLPGVKVPKSLQNIYKEIYDDLGIIEPRHGCLVEWARQGVLLLNTVLTVREGQPNSHAALGWQTFTDEVIKKLNQSEKPIVFLLWGANAKNKASLIDSTRHLVLMAAHPSPFSAASGFFGCKHFSKANQFLVGHGLEPINWQLSEIK